MHVRRTILYLAAIFLWATYDPDMASGQSSELSEQNAAMVRAIQEQVRGCWHPDPVTQSPEDIVVETRVLLNPDGSVKTVEILDVVRMIQDGYFRSAAENVKRAIMRCSPFRLPVEKYEVWKQLTLRFDPRRAKAKLPLEDQRMAKKEALLSKEDAAAMFLLSKEQWNDNVLRAHKQGVARAVSSPSAARCCSAHRLP